MMSNKIKIVLLSILVVIMLSTSVTFAIFYTDKSLSFQGDSADIHATYTPQLWTSKDFTGAGSTLTKQITVKNDGSVPFNYSIDTSLGTTRGLETAIILYIDGKVIGTLDNRSVKQDTPLYMGESRVHEIKLEYHIGASDFYTGKTFSLAVNIKASSCDVSDFIFVGNEKDFRESLLNTRYKNRNLVLTNDIVLTKPLATNNLANIDLNGHTITTTTANTLTFGGTDSGVFSLNNSIKPTTVGGVKAGGLIGSFVSFNAVNGLMTSEYPMTIVAGGYNKQLFESEFNNELDSKFDKPCDSDIFVGGKLSNYLSAINVMPNANYSFANLTFKPIRALSNKNVVVTIGVDGSIFTKNLTIVGVSDDSKLLELLNNNVSHLSTTSTELDPQEIANDIFLPILTRDKNATIQWLSSDSSTLDANGRIYFSGTEKIITLTALVTFNNTNYVHNYYVKVKPQALDDRFKLFELEYSPMTYIYVGENKTLPTIADLAKYGFDEITYDTAALTAGGVFGYVNNVLTLKIGTQIKKFDLPFIVRLGAVTKPGVLKIDVELASNVSIYDAVYNFIKLEVDKIPSYTLDGFSLSNNYAGLVNITYELFNGKYTLGETDYINRSDFTTFCSINQVGGSDKTNFVIDKYKLPQDNTNCYIKMKLDYNGNVQYRVLKFTVSGVLHNSAEDIKDISLYIQLSKKYDTNKDTFITRNEMTATNLTVLDLSKKGINDLKGIEFFTNITDLNLSYNGIVDLSKLSQLYKLTSLNLSNNKIINVAPIQNLVTLNNLYLDNNEIVDITSLKNLTRLKQFFINNNYSLNDFAVIHNFTMLTKLYAYNTKGAGDKFNDNNFITAYENARLANGGSEASLDYKLASATTQFKPLAEQVELSAMVNTIEPIYQFADVIYLPYSVNDFTITWTASHKDIVVIDNFNKTATITRPISDVNVYLYASISKKDLTVTRSIKVLSKGDSVALTILGKDAYVEIPDATLRYNLFALCDKNHDKNIDAAEIAAIKSLKLVGLNITNIKGLQLFTALTQLDITGNNILDLSIITGLPLTQLSVNGTPNYKQLYNGADNVLINALQTLTIYGSSNVNDSESINTLLTFLNKNSKLQIYKDAVDIVWNPFLEMLAKLSTKLEGYYLLSKGKPIVLPTTIDGSSYGLGAVAITYTRTNGAKYTLNANNLSLASIPANDVYDVLTATLTTNTGISITRNLTVVSLSQKDIFFNDGVNPLVLLESVFPNAVARQTVLDLYNGYLENGKKVIKTSDLAAITTITFDCINGDGLNGAQYLTSLTTLNITGYRHIEGKGAISSVVSGLKKLTTLKVEKSLIDLDEFAQCVSLTSITVTGCLKVKFDSVFTNMSLLTTLNLQDNNIKDFTGLTMLPNGHKLSTLRIYANPACTSLTTNSKISVVSSKKAASVVATYYVVADNILWKPTEQGDANITINDTYLGARIALASEYFANYIFSSNTQANCSTLVLPTTTIKGYPITWSSNAPSIIQITNNVATVLVGSYYKAYVVVTATIAVDGVNVNEQYIFVVSNKDVAACPSGVVNLDTFMMDVTTNGFAYKKLIDPYFTSSIFLKSSIANSITNGVITTSVASSLDSLDIVLPDGSRLPSGITSIKGIENFTGLRVISFVNHSIKDISPIANLTGLTYVNFINNNISTLKLLDNTSVFKNLTLLSQIWLSNNTLIDDFSGISYGDCQVVNGKDAWVNPRTGLGNLTYVDIGGYNTLSTVSHHLDFVGAWNTALGSKNASFKFYNGKTVGKDKFQEISNIDKLLKQMDSSQTVNTAATTNELKATVSDTNITPTVYNLGYQLIYDLTLSQANQPKYIIFAGATVQSFDSRFTNSANSTAPILVYVTLPGTTINIYRQINLIFTTVKTAGKVQITLEEKNGRFSGLTIETATDIKTGTTYWAKLADVMPDSMLRAAIFGVTDIHGYSYFDVNGDGNFDLGERALRDDNINFEYKGITDITGIDLFYRQRIWKLDGNDIKFIPQLLYRETESGGGIADVVATYYQINLSKNRNLTDISGIVATAPTGYVNAASILTDFTLFYCDAIDDSQVQYLGRCTKLKTLNLSNCKISSYEKLLPLAKTLRKLTINYAMLANNNINIIRKLILDTDNSALSSGETPLDTTGISISTSVKLSPSIVSQYLPKSVYTVNTETLLPESFAFMGKTYYLKYSAVGSMQSAYSLRESGGKYYITIKSGAPTLVDIKAQVWHYPTGSTTRVNSYLEVLTLTTSSTTTEIVDKYETFDGYVQRVAGGATNTELLSKYVKDEMLRYYFFLYIDTNHDKIITYNELGATTFAVGDRQKMIGSFEGIDILYALQTLTLNFVRCNDFAPLSKLTTLKTLTINECYAFIYNLNFLSTLTNLTKLDLINSEYSNLSSIENLPNLAELANINTQKMAKVLFIRNSVAYAELENKLYFYNIPRATTDEKIASKILSKVTYNLVDSLPTSIVYDNVSYMVTYRSISPNLSFSSDNKIVFDTTYRKTAAFVIRVTYNGAVYERLITVK